MITRYYRFMQLKAYHPANILLIPTIDIEIVWQTHLLRPEIYQADCRHLFRRVIDHSLLINDIQQHIKEQAFQDTCQLYEQRFGEQYCPLTSIDEKKEAKSNVSHDSSGTFCCIGENYSYWDNTYYKFPLKIPKDYENPFSFTDADIIIDMNWLDFCKQFMANPKCNSRFFNHNLDQRHKLRFGHDAMKKLEKSYERFLYMAAKYPLKDGNVFISPTYAIDIIWHSHMQEPLKYVADCIRLVGYVINHSPWPQIDDHTMKKSCDKTNDIWKEEFDSDITTDHV
ncbi:unnamed protein product [Rotaria sp. Silwood2]|nr:unnamed protein product [Rotaria sp. Silwood2]CAF3074374.1 unnamed protein product [Rotaria sp. Silwood2]CAF3996837.1 unnamed protein product [Rotaria sp. Silwood2]